LPGLVTAFFLSTNNGTSWTAIIIGPMVSSLAVNGGNLFVGTNGGYNGGGVDVLFSTNNGTSWIETGSGWGILASSLLR